MPCGADPRRGHWSSLVRGNALHKSLEKSMTGLRMVTTSGGNQTDRDGIDDQTRRLRYEEALAFYRGEQWPSARRRGETRLTVNYARALLRKVASYVFPAPVTFNVELQAAGSKLQAVGGDEELATAANVAERSLAEAIAENDL